jgi:hypothetical protein
MGTRSRLQPTVEETKLCGPGLPYRIDPIAHREAVVYFCLREACSLPPQGARIEVLH